MSDYIYMLESHLSPDQNRAVAVVQRAAGEAGLNLFLTGGAMRDMLAGFRIRDLDFVVEGNPLMLVKALASAGATVISTDETRKSAALLFPGGITAKIAMARREKAGRSGARPQITPATIQEDLRGRDFTCNAIALSLNKASRGLLLDPLNGLADIEHRELRAASAYAFYDVPSRLLRLMRLRVRLGFGVEERTQAQAANALGSGAAQSIPAHVLGEELKQIALEDSPSEILKLLEESKLIGLFSPALSGPKLNLGGVMKLEKGARLLSDDTASRSARFAPFLSVLTEKLTVRERSALVKAAELAKSDVAQWQKLQARSKKLETALRSARIRKPSQVYHLVVAAPPDEVLFLLYHSALKPVQERLRSHFQKYLPAVQEITAEEWAQVEGTPGTPRYQKARQEFITRRLDRRPKPAAPPAAAGAPAGTAAAPGAEGAAPKGPEVPPPAPTRGTGWRAQPGTVTRGVRAGRVWGGQA
jgi:tRNA nucleotidyltransferase (CCA-adding enzyme)